MGQLEHSQEGRGKGGRELEFLGLVGQGGFGSVYLANLHGRDRFVRRVAVKLLRADGSSSAAAKRQRDEGRLLGLLAHENIVQVLELAELGGRPAVIMEYVQGVDLATVLEKHGALPLRAASELLAQVAGALGAAWEAPSPVDGQPLRVVHRDIKPANVLLTPGGVAKVLDFGIARGNFERDGETSSGIWGTPRFMAPEVWLEKPVGPAVDSYALGVMTVEFLKGKAMVRAPLEEGRYRDFVEESIAGLPIRASLLVKELLSWEAAKRPSHRAAREEFLALASANPGESLTMLASRVVPGLVQRRERGSLPPELPGRVTLDTGTLEAAVPDSPLEFKTIGVGALLVGLGLVGGLGLLLGVGWVVLGAAKPMEEPSVIAPVELQPVEKIEESPVVTPVEELPVAPPEATPEPAATPVKTAPKQTVKATPVPEPVAPVARSIRFVSRYRGSKVEVGGKSCLSPCELGLAPGSYGLHWEPPEGPDYVEIAPVECALVVPSAGPDQVRIGSGCGWESRK